VKAILTRSPLEQQPMGFHDAVDAFDRGAVFFAAEIAGRPGRYWCDREGVSAAQ